jgi:hypothetical protein
MKVVVHQEFNATRKEPLGQLIRRLAAVFDVRRRNIAELFSDPREWSPSCTSVPSGTVRTS